MGATKKMCTFFWDWKIFTFFIFRQNEYHNYTFFLSYLMGNALER